MDIIQGEKIRIDGFNRRPDVQVYAPNTKTVLKVYEAERYPNRKPHIERLEEYKHHGIPCKTEVVK